MPDLQEPPPPDDAAVSEAAVGWDDIGGGTGTPWPWPPIERVLDREPITTLAGWEALGGRKALDAARATEPIAVIETLDASGLRGRGGAGFPTGTKWRTIAGYLSDTAPATVVVNGAEGEPGSFKDRTILLRNPYRVIEGALIAASVMGADEVVLALKSGQDRVAERVRSAVAEIVQAGWAGPTRIDVVLGPPHYLYGEETALLEVLDGRQPFPRLAPPWREGVDVAPTLVDNVETLANVPGIVLQGPEWFRSIGTAESPGSLVVTLSGAVRQDVVGEVAMGTTLGEVIEHMGGGTAGTLMAVLPGVSNGVLTADQLDTPLTYEAMAAAGSGLGSGAYLVIDDHADPVAVAHGASRFLAVESCGQCTPCKQDGIAIADSLDRLRRTSPDEADLDLINRRLDTIGTGARCSLATQHETVVRSLMTAFPDAFAAHAERRADPVDPYPVAEIVDLQGRQATLDLAHLDKQPDWTGSQVDSGQAPADRIDQHQGEG